MLEPTFFESSGSYKMAQKESRAIYADREVWNVATKQNFNMQVCGHKEKSR